MKKYLFTGFIIIIPAALTLMVIVFLFDLFTTPFAPLFKFLLYRLEDLLAVSFPEWLNIFLSRLSALIVLAVFVLLLGMLASKFFFRNLIRGTHSLLAKIPFIKTIFKVSRDVFSAIFSEGKKAFREPVMIPFPDYPNHSIGFAVGEVPQECQEKSGHNLVAVFSPTAPHPMSGFLIFVDEKDVYSIQMSNEDALKLIVSCGMIVPENHDKSQ
jgi:uncharacterized membrane protein